MCDKNQKHSPGFILANKLDGRLSLTLFTYVLTKESCLFKKKVKRNSQSFDYPILFLRIRADFSLSLKQVMCA